MSCDLDRAGIDHLRRTGRALRLTDGCARLATGDFSTTTRHCSASSSSMRCNVGEEGWPKTPSKLATGWPKVATVQLWFAIERAQESAVTREDRKGLPKLFVLLCS